MRVISTVIVSVLALLVVPTMVSAAPDPYPGIVITSIDAKQPNLMLWLGDNAYFREVDVRLVDTEPHVRGRREELRRAQRARGEERERRGAHARRGDVHHAHDHGQQPFR